MIPESFVSSCYAFFLSENFFKIILSFVLAAILGMERDIHGRSAGLRTHILVNMGAALFTIIAIEASYTYANVDPTRVVSQIVTGIGFLGAGVIIKSGINVRGLTTAASVWVDAAVGSAIGLGAYAPAVCVTVVSLFVLLILSRVEGFYYKWSVWELVLKVNSKDLVPETVKNLVNTPKVKSVYIEYSKDYKEQCVEYRVRCKVFYRKTTYEQLQEVTRRLEDDIDQITSLHWIRQ